MIQFYSQARRRGPMTAEIRFVYASYRTRERAELALEDMYATGDVFESERPRIEHKGGRWVITLPAG